ncbi:AIR synthase related protein [Nonomuraea sp. NPDC003201]
MSFSGGTTAVLGPAKPCSPGSATPRRTRSASSSSGTDAGDDAAVVRIQGDVAVVSTADSFMPMVGNPYDWGRIAAANAVGRLCDGGRPLIGLNLLVCRSNIELRGLSCG